MPATILAVIICTFNREKLLARAIESLSRQTLSSELFEIIVVDNGSTDNTAQIVNKLLSANSNIKYVRENQQGLSFARNRGWRLSVAPYIAYIDDDAVADIQWAERIINAFQEVHPKPDAVGGKILPIYHDPAPVWFDDSIETHTWGEIERYLDSKQEPMGFYGSNMAFTRETLENLGGFSANYGMQGVKMRFGEDSEFFARMGVAGKIIYYDPKLIVYHSVWNQNYKYSYIAKRFYNIGISRHDIDSILGVSKVPVKTMWEIVLSILHIPYFIIMSNFSFKMNIAIKVRRLSYLLGYLSRSLFCRNYEHPEPYHD
jgi:glycosyltransferase involved in cell wall biosynthesis